MKRIYLFFGQMKMNFFLLQIFVLSGFFLGCGCIETSDVSPNSSPGIQIIDSLNHTVFFEKPVDRIVTLDSYSAEVLIALGASSKVVGIQDHIKNNPLFKEHFTKSQITGSGAHPNIEKIIQLHPDVVILASTASSDVKQKITDAKLKVVYFDCYYLSTLPSSIKEIGRMVGAENKSIDYLNYYQKYENLLDKRIGLISSENRPIVYYEMSKDYMAAGNNSGGYFYLEKLKAINIAGQLGERSPIISLEWIISNNPDYIIKICDQSYSMDNITEIGDKMNNRAGISELNASKNHRIIVISSNILYGPREIIGLIYLGKEFYPNLFKDIEPHSILEEYANQFIPDADDTDTIFKQ